MTPTQERMVNQTRDALALAHGDLTGQVIGAFYDVYNDLWRGYVESVYARSMVVELSARAIACEREAPLVVRYRDIIVGEFRADLLVERKIIVEVKVGDKITAAHQRQLLNYLRVSGLSVGLILNVGERPSVKRLIWTGERSQLPSTETR